MENKLNFIKNTHEKFGLVNFKLSLSEINIIYDLYKNNKVMEINDDILYYLYARYYLDISKDYTKFKFYAKKGIANNCIYCCYLWGYFLVFIKQKKNKGFVFLTIAYAANKYQAALTLGKYYFNEKNIPMAEQCYQQAIIFSQTEFLIENAIINAYRDIAFFYYNISRFDIAVNYYLECGLYLSVAKCCFLMNNDIIGEKYLIKYLGVSNTKQTNFTKAQIYFDLKKYTRSLNLLLNNNDSESYRLIGRIFLRLNKCEMAKKYLELAIEMGNIEAFQIWYENLKTLNIVKDLSKLENYIIRLDTLTVKKKSEIYYSVASKISEAEIRIKYYIKAIALDNHHFSYDKLFYYYLQNNNHEYYLLSLKAIDAGYAKGYSFLAYHYQLQNKIDQAIINYKKSIDLGCANSALLLAMFLQENNRDQNEQNERNDQIEYYFKKAIELGENNAYECLGKYYFRKNDFGQSKKYLLEGMMHGSQECAIIYAKKYLNDPDIILQLLRKNNAEQEIAYILQMKKDWKQIFELDVGGNYGTVDVVFDHFTYKIRNNLDRLFFVVQCLHNKKQKLKSMNSNLKN